MHDSPPAHPGVRFPPPLLFVGGFTGGWLLQRAWPLPLPGVATAGVRFPIGWLAIGLGLLLMLWGLMTFRRARTAILPHRPARRIVQSGPYRFTRNPMYLGLTLAYLGGSLLLASWWPVVLLPLVLAALTYAVIRREERYLAAAFGSEYEAYRRRVRRWL